MVACCCRCLCACLTVLAVCQCYCCCLFHAHALIHAVFFSSIQFNSIRFNAIQFFQFWFTNFRSCNQKTGIFNLFLQIYAIFERCDMLLHLFLLFSLMMVTLSSTATFFLVGKLFNDFCDFFCAFFFSIHFFCFFLLLFQNYLHLNFQNRFISLCSAMWNILVCVRERCLLFDR